MNNKCVIVYHSRTGNCEKVAKKLQSELKIPGSNIEKIVLKTQPKSFFQKFKYNIPYFGNFEIENVRVLDGLREKKFDYFIFIAPIHSWTLSLEAQTFLNQIKDDIHEFGIQKFAFCQCSGSSSLKFGLNKFCKILGLNKDDVIATSLKDYSKTREKEISAFSDNIQSFIEEEKKIKENEEKKEIKPMKIVNV